MPKVFFPSGSARAVVAEQTALLRRHFFSNSSRRFASTQAHNQQRFVRPLSTGFFPSSSRPSLVETVCRDYLPLNRPYPYILASIHHLFPSFAPLALELSKRMPLYVLGKPYSTSPPVVNFLSRQKNIKIIPNKTQQRYGDFEATFREDVQVLLHTVKDKLRRSPEYKGVIFLDHGGDALAAIDVDFAREHRIVAIEHTTKGIKNLQAQGAPLNVIELATAAFKREVESHIIEMEIESGLRMALGVDKLSKEDTYGVVGYGAVGERFANELARKGYKVVAYDIADKLRTNGNNSVQFVSSLETLLYLVDTLVSVTGEDITFGKNFILFNNINKPLNVASGSSGDIEFRTLMLNYQKQIKSRYSKYQSFATISYKNNCGHTISVLNGGTPVNMPDPSRCIDGKNELSSEENISLTRAGVVFGIRQAADLLEQPPKVFDARKNYMFDPTMQKDLVEQWLSVQTLLDTHIAAQIRAQFQDEQWIIRHSGQGILLEPPNHTQSPLISCGAQHTN